TDGHDEKGRGGPALLCKRIPVEGRDDGGRLSRHVQKDRCCRSSIHASIVYPRDHDDGGSRLHRIGERKNKRRATEWTQAGKNADGGPQGGASQCGQKVLGKKGYFKAL